MHINLAVKERFPLREVMMVWGIGCKRLWRRQPDRPGITNDGFYLVGARNVSTGRNEGGAQFLHPKHGSRHHVSGCGASRF